MPADSLDDELRRSRFPAVPAAAGTQRTRLGLSPHSPYTSGPDLLRAVSQRAESLGLPLAIHVAESAAESELIARGTGPLAPTASRTADGFAPTGGSSRRLPGQPRRARRGHRRPSRRGVGGRHRAARRGPRARRDRVPALEPLPRQSRRRRARTARARHRGWHRNRFGRKQRRPRLDGRGPRAGRRAPRARRTHAGRHRHAAGSARRRSRRRLRRARTRRLRRHRRLQRRRRRPRARHRRAGWSRQPRGAAVGGVWRR